MAAPGTAAFAAAKLNLYLHVTGRRPDGYHELDSLVAFADIGDTVTVAPAAGFSLRIEGAMAAGLSGGSPADNLVARAVHALAALLDRPPDVAVRLVKRLPVASGIGGGSADAAAALRALASLWELPAEDPRPAQAAPALGADVPVCLHGRAARMTGIGERVEPVAPLPEAGVLLVNPGVPLPTPAVFRARSGPFSEPAPLERPPATAAELGAMLADRRNDLTVPALATAPVVGEVLERLSGLPGCLLARLSGSGATCFGLFADAAAASRGQAALGAPRGWWVRAGRLVRDARLIPSALR
ncbi:4-(cytidine 5'-diphospho)-2-C-methyl-D-erythritol kinase [Arenibaculum pallidiluteum]|uniref:4-(cytidine 5'-diphospho)-2-C-methyl-D-erythritol kinase n=1 Tax=Arenibaculum pallidiluteum TaxID=2812559 RepID=UPI001A957580|nr:4-(cytidine 5'-diphospho)-2-C-methyl-D-erythritol kinase [Arenibaculum pallidiluteum]